MPVVAAYGDLQPLFLVWSMTCPFEPLAPQFTPPAPTAHALRPDEPLPHRKVLRSWLLPMAQRSTWRALGLLAFDYVLWLALLAGVALAGAVWLKLVCGLSAGIVIGRLFIVGHDGCHNTQQPDPAPQIEQVAGAHRLSALTGGLQPVGCWPQHGAPRLYQPRV